MTHKIYEKLKTNPGQTWLVTGAAGFIGSNIVEKLLILKQKVIAFDNFSTGHKNNLKLAKKNAEDFFALADIKFNEKNFSFIEGDIRNLLDCHKACKDVNFVLHQAALGSVPRSLKNPILTNEVNISGFLNILVAARDANVDNFVYAASSSTYGDHKALPKIEENIGKPLSPYAVTKLANEIYADVFFKSYGFNSIGLRYFNVFGKRQDPNSTYAAVIPLWIDSLINDKQVTINGDGETSRDFCYIDNVVQANIISALSKNSSSLNQVYNIAAGKRTSLIDLYNLIKKQLSYHIEIKSDLKPIYGPFRDGDVRHSLADISKAQKKLGYIPFNDIESGMKLTIESYIEARKNK